MSLLQPISATCYELKLPPVVSGPADAVDGETLSESARRSLTLECRTGAAVNHSRSNIFVHGGLTIPLNLQQVNSVHIQQELIMYFAKEKDTSASFKTLHEWISPETFYLDLISTTWHKVPTEVEPGLSFKRRLFHSICYTNGCLYIFGGLVISPQSGYELVPTNSLWRLDLNTKRWSLVSSDTIITNRFNHTMHVKNENDDHRDTKLVIVGGLDEKNQPVTKIDIFNLTQNRWDDESLTDNPLNNIETNVDGKRISLTSNLNFSILVENNEAKVPALAYYVPSIAPAELENTDKTIRSTESTVVKEQARIDTTITRDKFSAPFIALPLIKNSRGMRMATNLKQRKETLEVPLKLQFPTGDYFSYNIITAGFYPKPETSNFYCFSYDIHSGNWTRINTSCIHHQEKLHRFWKVFVWKSHRHILLLGTKNNDSNLPTVQKFDYLQIFSLPMISMYNKMPVNDLNHNNMAAASDDASPDYSFPASSATMNKPSFAASTTSQFENYIRYIAPPIEMSSVKSTFPSYAMVLGKDALEIFGNPLSDFEFVTEDGESIAAPIYLLRKRWGRYFDLLLSQSYSKIYLEYENSASQPGMFRLSSQSSPMSHPKLTQKSTSISRVASYQNEKPRRKSFPTEAINRLSVSDAKVRANSMSRVSRQSSNASDNNDTKQSIQTDENGNNNDTSERRYSSPYSHTGASTENPNHDSAGSPSGLVSTMSSLSGMVFRVPFQESMTAAKTVTSANDSSSSGIMRRRSCSAHNRESFTPTSFEMKRQLSQPTTVGADGRQNSQILPRKYSFGSYTSRQASITSQNSIISYVSSSSDRYGNNIGDNHEKHGGVAATANSMPIGVITFPLPPRQDPPTEPVPAVPAGSPHTNYLPAPDMKQKGSISSYLHSSKSSPLSSRRSSYYNRVNVGDIRRVSNDVSKNSLNGQSGPEPQLDEILLKADLSRSRLNSWPKSDMGSDDHKRSMASSSDTGSLRSAPVFESLLTPRTLYMPWPTSSVRAFAEFFYTGQVNVKWVLAPVVLSLLVMSKIYEVHLLYSMITEVLYSIICRKEESLMINCDSMLNMLRSRGLRYFPNDESKLEEYLYTMEEYTELLKLKESLESIGSGFFDPDIIRKFSRGNSASTNFTSESEYTDRASRRNSSMGNTQSTHFNSGVLRNMRLSSDSSDNRGIRQSVNSTTPKFRRMSKLKYGIDLLSGNSSPESELRLIDEQLEQVKLRNLSKMDGNVEMDEPEKTQAGNELKNTTSLPGSKTEKDEISNVPAKSECSSESSSSSDGVESSEDDSSSSSNSHSDSDEWGTEFGMFSMSKMQKELDKNEEKLDDSIDPLAKISDSKISSNIEPGGNSGTNENTNVNTTAHAAGIAGVLGGAGNLPPTLENLMSPNALPPVDYVIKSIYRTAVLVSDVRLIVRCLDCIEISKSLKCIRRNITGSLTKIELDLKHLDSAPTWDSRNSVPAKVGMNNNSNGISGMNGPLSPRTSTTNLMMGLNALNLSEPKDSKRSSQLQISPKTSISKEVSDGGSPVKEYDAPSNASSNRVCSKAKSKSKRFTVQSPGSTSILMNPAITPPPPPQYNSMSGKSSKQAHAGGRSN